LRAGALMLYRGVLFAVLYAAADIVVDRVPVGEALRTGVIGGIFFALLTEAMMRWFQRRGGAGSTDSRG